MTNEQVDGFHGARATARRVLKSSLTLLAVLAILSVAASAVVGLTVNHFLIVWGM